MLPMAFAVFIGVVLPIQTAVNSRLRGVLGSPLRASLGSFCVGTIALMIAVIVTGGTIGLSADVIAAQPWWIWLGGVLGVIFLTGNIVLFPHLGSVQTVLMPILGQILAGDVIDSFGWFSSAAHPFTVARGVGTCIAVVGMLLVVVGPHLRRAGLGAGAKPHDVSPGEGSPEPRRRRQWVWQIAGIGTGVLSAMQTAINGDLGTRLGSPVKAASISFFVGTVVLAILVVGQRALHPVARVEPSARPRMQWWFWTGGVLGALFVYGNATLAPILGTGVTVVVVLLGQLAGSLAVDQFGLLGSNRRPVRAIQLCGLVVLMAGAAIMRLL